jgi:hypothetical protein
MKGGTGTMDGHTRLEKLHFRLQAQHACLDWAIGEIAGRPGPVFEIGLGHGRTYDHLRTRLTSRDIYVFDREIDCIPDCTPPADRLMLGDMGETLRAATKTFARQVVLAHADTGTYEDARNTENAILLSALLPPLLARGAIVLSDLPLSLAGATALPLPPPAREGRYFAYRMTE